MPHPGVKGERAGPGGNCDSCATQLALSETSAKYELSSNTEVGMSVLVAIVIAGCTHD